MLPYAGNRRKLLTSVNKTLSVFLVLKSALGKETTHPTWCIAYSPRLKCDRPWRINIFHSINYQPIIQVCLKWFLLYYTFSNGINTFIQTDRLHQSHSLLHITLCNRFVVMYLTNWKMHMAESNPLIQKRYFLDVVVVEWGETELLILMLPPHWLQRSERAKYATPFDRCPLWTQASGRTDLRTITLCIST